MSANVTCTACGMELEVLAISDYRLTDVHSTTYYHIPALNEHMQLHEEA